jgi:riboflavin synthase
MKKLGIIEVFESKLDVTSMIESGVESKLQVEIKKKTVPRLKESLVPVKALMQDGCDIVVIPAIIPEPDKALITELEKNILSLELEMGKHIFLHILDFEEIDQKDEKKMQGQVMEFITNIVEYTLAFLLDDKEAMKKILEAESKKDEKKKSEGDLL